MRVRDLGLLSAGLVFCLACAGGVSAPTPTTQTTPTTGATQLPVSTHSRPPGMGAPDPVGATAAPNTGILTFGDTTFQMTVVSCTRYPYPFKATLETAGGGNFLVIVGQTRYHTPPEFLIEFNPEGSNEIWQFQGDGFSWSSTWNDDQTYWHGTLSNAFISGPKDSTISLGC